MSARIDDLEPSVVAAAMASLDSLGSANIPVVVTSTYRTPEEQIALYSQGRAPLDKVNALRAKAHLHFISDAENKYRVTNCDGVNTMSRHQSGRALDVVPAVNGNPVWPPKTDGRWAQISMVFKHNGFKWGGDWVSFPDYPHFEM